MSKFEGKRDNTHTQFNGHEMKGILLSSNIRIFFIFSSFSQSKYETNWILIFDVFVVEALAVKESSVSLLIFHVNLSMLNLECCWNLKANGQACQVVYCWLLSIATHGFSVNN